MVNVFRPAVGVAAVLLALLSPAGASGATINVTSTDDAANPAGCSLREAVEAAKDNAAHQGCPAGSASPASDTIILPAGTIDLDLAPVDEDLNAGGDIDLPPQPLTIRGAGRTATTVSTALNDRVFQLGAGSPQPLTIEALTVSGGDSTGLPGDMFGGNILLPGNNLVNLRNLRVTGGLGLVGGGVYASNATILTITDSVIETNDALARGGGLALANDAAATLTRTTVDGNKADKTLTASPGNVDGGGIFSNADSTLTVTDSVISDNQAISDDDAFAGGGGIDVENTNQLTVQRSLISGNAVSSTGTGFESGGGIGTENTPTSIVNSTIYDNEGDDQNGGGGGVFAFGGSSVTNINHVSFLGNTADEGGSHVHAAGSAVLNVRASIIPGSSPVVDPCGEVSAAVNSQGFNVAAFNDAECGFSAGSGDVTSGATGMALGPPVDNGGPTATLALAASGTALNRVPAASCGPAGGLDQRGAPRPGGAGCDSGAYERVTCQGVLAGASAVFAALSGGNLSGTNGADVLIGSPVRDQINGRAGKDVACAGAGNDKLFGSGGPDTLLGEAGNDAIRGGAGNDVARGGAGKDKLFGEAGKDKLFGQAGKDRLLGGPGRDVLRGGPGRDRQKQ